jgi:hypothetical protein
MLQFNVSFVITESLTDTVVIRDKYQASRHHVYALLNAADPDKASAFAKNYNLPDEPTTEE